MPTPHELVEASLRLELASIADPWDAMTRAVETLKARMLDYSWVGVYLLDGDELVLGPYRGKPSPHTRIPLARGICGAAATSKTTIVVDDVNEDPRYLACSVETRSEIVVPILRGDTVVGEIDVDSDRLSAFGPDDCRLIESVAALLADTFPADPPRG